MTDALHAMTLLNIEDNPDAQESFRKLVSQISGGSVLLYQATTLKAGLELDNEKRPDVVLLDLILPDSPTWQETVEKIPEFKDPVIVVTAYNIAENDYEPFIACMRAGVKRVFEKPQMPAIWRWLGENPKESFSARLLGTAGNVHLDHFYGHK